MSGPTLSDPIALVIEARPRDLGGFGVRRALPSGGRRMVGPFIFFDHIGPSEMPPGQGINIQPHPHIALATVTYLFAGEMDHRDSLGSHQTITPGDVNWMLAGRGIVHSERTGVEARRRGGPLHGIQSWVALPTADEDNAPASITIRRRPSRTSRGRARRCRSWLAPPTARARRSASARRRSTWRRRWRRARRCRSRTSTPNARFTWLKEESAWEHGGSPLERWRYFMPAPPRCTRSPPAASSSSAARRSTASGKSGGTSSPARPSASNGPNRTGERDASASSPATSASFIPLPEG